MASTVELHTAVEPAGPSCQDIAAALALGEEARLIVADGAGGLSGGREAALLIVAVMTDARPALAPEVWAARLRALDRELLEHPRAGWSTAVVAVWQRDRIVGASVGDSGAWLFTDEDLIELTAGQQRKPLLGTGQAAPRGFSHRLKKNDARLLIASDGLLKYAAIDELWLDALEPKLEDGARRMIERVRLPSGAFRDDVSLALGRRRETQ